MNNFKKPQIISVALCVFALLVGSNALAFDAEAGKKKAEQVCASCHGLDGVGIIPTYPNLAGQYVDYLTKALKDYRSGQRSNAIMAGFAATLSDEEIQNLAYYYATLKENRLPVLDLK
ncbi:cytochrome c [Marinicella pacifica]|jgi:cytochrome c553|uniref:Cytochrome c n=1 Tax=Marinicella pacifica TaxID=1171543 RepID=A0A917CVB3_9GAMM|nr:cytochrome c [Marinicella pacifica]GGF98210.1 cytochrome c [Marinicella pacifica]